MKNWPRFPKDPKGLELDDRQISRGIDLIDLERIELSMKEGSILV
jgi:hypothetical protein